MTRKTRIRFLDTQNRYYVQTKHWFLFIPYWSTSNKKGYYSTDDPEVRFFDTYAEARKFCIKMATDVLVEHKANELKTLS